MSSLSNILADASQSARDGRPLYRYPLNDISFGGLEEGLRSGNVWARRTESFAAAFVLWAAEHIRARYTGGGLTWAFVLKPVGLGTDDHQLGRDLTERGLAWWRRDVRKSNAGFRMFLYSLMAEGGIPEALLQQPGLYRDVVMGLLIEMEEERGPVAAVWAEQIAGRWVKRLPQTFQNSDTTRLLSGLALALVELRATLPQDVPEAAAVQWLNIHRPDWKSCIPLRMTPDIAESLIRPALETERESAPASTRPLCVRELRKVQAGKWSGFLRLSDESWVPEHLFPGATGLRLRLLPTAGDSNERMVFSAVPEGAGWRVRKMGRAKDPTIPLSPYSSFALSAFADGQAKGSAVVEAGIPEPVEGPSFWRSAEASDGDSPSRLVPLAGAARTRSPWLWVLTQENIEPKPEHGTGLALEDVEAAPRGLLWRVSGAGVLRIGDRHHRIETGSDEEALEVRLIPFGEKLRGWQLKGSIPVYCGDPGYYGQVGSGPAQRIPVSEIKRVAGRALGSEIVEWVRKGETLTRIKLVSLPAATRFGLQERGPGRLAFFGEGVGDGWGVQLRAGEAEAAGVAADERIGLALETKGNVPGIVRLRLYEPSTGRSLELESVWPARSGMILDPEGMRLSASRPISVKALYGWRGVVPEQFSGDLQVRLTGHDAICLPAAGEVTLASYMPMIEAMLAQGGPDAQINLSLVVFGRESDRLEIRRYHDEAVVKGAILYLGIERERQITSDSGEESHMNADRRAELHGVDLESVNQIGPVETGVPVDLQDVFGDTGGPWLIQCRLEDRLQRAVVWSAKALTGRTRESRVKGYADEWQRLVSVPEDPEWDRLSELILTAGKHGDAGALDQVQALEEVPVAAVLLTLRVPYEELSRILDLDTAAPIFWPCLKVSDFTEAVRGEHARWLKRLAPFLDSGVAETAADKKLVRRIGEILAVRPELAGHFCKSLVDAGLFERVIGIREHQERLAVLFMADPAARLIENAQDAARRFDRLPQGIRELVPRKRLGVLPEFNSYVQRMIDAPVVAAEMAASMRAQPKAEEKLALISLRLVDPLYFDAALPAALELYTSGFIS